jgi:hypothetical protein
MYAQLIGEALERVTPGETRTPGEVLSELIRSRSFLEPSRSTDRSSSWVPEAVAHQLTYDVALVELARGHGIDCDPLAFDQPQEERSRLETALASRGVQLVELAGPPSTS